MQRPSTFDFRLGLIGYPLGHSLSPKIHNAALRACGLQGGYSLFPIHKDDKHGLKDLLTRVRSGEIHGLNVTIPHKQNVIEYIDELTPVANAISAVNTIYLRESKLVGDNTDASGFLSDLKRHMGNWELGVGKSVLILGAGGSARAVVYALANHGWIVTITSRRLAQAQELAAQFKNAKTIELNFETFQPSNFQLIV
ncbi:MAG: shikimate dehydrogenase, partial [Legionella sp.]|nr:shikimate dehydrogenase [Legionella sp.]